MNVACAIGGHQADRREVYNCGYYFSLCRRCGRQLMRSAKSDWAMVPRGHRVAWKAGRHSHSLAADYTGVLPVAVGEAAPAASRRPLASTSRSLIRVKPMRGPAARSACAVAAEEESGDYHYPRLLLMAVVVGAGLKMLLGFGSGR